MTDAEYAALEALISEKIARDEAVSDELLDAYQQEEAYREDTKREAASLRDAIESWQANARDQKEAAVKKLTEGGMPEAIARRIVAERGKV